MTSGLATIASTVPQSDAAYAVGFLGRLAVMCFGLFIAFKFWLVPWAAFMDRYTERIVESRGRLRAFVVARRHLCGSIVVLSVLVAWLVVTDNPVMYRGTSSRLPILVMLMAVPYYCFVVILWGKTADLPWGSPE